MHYPQSLTDEILRSLDRSYGIEATEIVPLSGGADFNTVVYRVMASDGKQYYLKLRRDQFLHASVLVPLYLFKMGMSAVIPSITSTAGEAWVSLGTYVMILYPFVVGHNAVECPLSDQQWMRYGEIMKKLHTTPISDQIMHILDRETFQSPWPNIVSAYIEQIDHEDYHDAVAQQAVVLLRSKKTEILHCVNRAVLLADILKKQSFEYTLCHADMHLWNLFVSETDDLYIVDWDTLILAPKERDLMFIGAGISSSGRTPAEEELLFYKGYGKTDINYMALAYYRYVRIVEDIGEYCQHIFSKEAEQSEKQQSLRYLAGNFAVGGTIERARTVDNFFHY